MWRSGTARRRRHTVLADMVREAVRAEEYSAPWRVQPGVWELFTDESDVLRELQQQWRTELAGAIYVAIESGDGDLQSDVVQAFIKVKKRHLGVRRILEANVNHPAIASTMRKERALLSSFGVLPGDSTQAA